MAGVNQDLDMSGFAKEFERALNSVTRAEKGMIRFIDVTQKLEKTKAGDVIQNLVLRVEALETPGQKVIRTYEKVGRTWKRVSQTAKALTDDTKKLAAAQDKVQQQNAEGANLRNQFAFDNTDPSRRQGNPKEKNRLNAAQNDLVRFVEAGRASAKQVKSIYDSVINGTFQAGDASSRLLRLVLNLIDAENRQGRAAEQAASRSAKAKARLGIGVQKAIDQLNREIALEQQKAAIIAHNISESNKVRTVTRAPGQDLRTRGEGGKGTVDQIQSFLNAERALERLAIKGKASFAEIQNAIGRARTGTLSMASATTDAERAALRLVAAEKRIGQEAVTSSGLVRKMADGFINLGKITAIGILLGNMFRLQSAIEDATRTAVEFSIRIGQIQTVEEGPTFGTERWAQSLRELSDSFGIPLLNQVEGAYNTLQNQVAQGADAILFMESANRLAITAVTDTANAVETLTSVLKAYGKPVEDAELVSARLFRISELGRVKIEELSNTFGRIAVPASLLGVSLEELGAAITVTTVQGFRFEAASTLIRNIMLKLIRPTSDLKEFFGEIGVNSGEAAIETFGFAGVLSLLEARTKGSSTEIGELFHELRANTGVMSLLADGGKGFEEALKKIRDTDINSFMEDTNRILETSGQQLRIAAEQAKNFFEIEIGQRAINAAADIIRELGGVQNILVTFGDTVRTVATFSLPLLTIQFGKASAAALIYAASTATATTASARLAAAVALAGGPLGALAVGIGTLTVGAIELYRRSSNQALREAEDANLRLLKSLEDAERQSTTAQRGQTEAQTAEVDRRNRLLLQEVANRRKALALQQNDLKKASEAIEREFGLVNKRFNSFLTQAINRQEKKFSDARRAIEQSVEAIRDSLESAVSKPLEFDLKIAGLGKRSAILESQIEDLQKQAQAAATSGDFDAFDRLRKQIEQLAEERMNTEIEFAKERSKLNVAEREARKRLTEATTAEESDAAERALDGIQKQMQLLRSGTQSQIELERERQQIKERIASSETPEDVSALTKELQAVESKQKDINKLVLEERNIRLEGLQTTKSLAEQLLQINEVNTQRAAEAAKETAALKAAQFSYNLLTKEAEAFDAKEILAKDTAEEVTEAISKQQSIYARLIALQQKLGAGEEATEIVREKALNLQQQTQAKLEQLRADEDQKRFNALNDRLKAELAGIQDATRADLQRMNIIEQRVLEISKLKILETARSNQRIASSLVTTRLLDQTENQRRIGQVFANAFLPTRDKLAGTVSLIPPDDAQEIGRQLQELDRTLSDLGKAIAAQKKDPSAVNTAAVSELARVAANAFKPLEARISQKDATQQTAEERERIREFLAQGASLDVLGRTADSIARQQATTEELLRQQGKVVQEFEKKADETASAVPQQAADNERALEAIQKFIEGRKTRSSLEAPGLGEIPNVQSVDEEVGAVFGEGVKDGIAQNQGNLGEAGQGMAQAYANEIRSGQAAKVLQDAAVKTAQIQARTYQEQQKINAPDVAKTVAEAEADAAERAAVLGLGRQEGPFLDGKGNLVTRPAPGLQNSGHVGLDGKGNLVTRNTSFEDFAKANAKIQTPTPLDPNSPEGKALAAAQGQRQDAEVALTEALKERKSLEESLTEANKDNPNFGKTPEQVLQEFQSRAPEVPDAELAERQRIFQQRLQEFELRGGSVQRGLPPLRTPQEQAEREARFNRILHPSVGQIGVDEATAGPPIIINMGGFTVNEATDGQTTALDIERIVSRALRARAIEFKQGLRNKP